MERRLRVRRTLRRRWGLVVVVLAGLAVAGAWLSVTAFVAPGTTTDERVTDSWRRSGAFTHGATVVEPNPAFAVGAPLENRSTYLRQVAPRANVTYGVGYSASESGRVDTTVRLRLVRRATDADGGVLWQVSEPLGRANRTLEPGERVQVPTTLNVGTVRNRTRNLTDQLGTVGGVETLLVVETRLDGRVNDEAVSQRFTQQVTLTVSGDTYRIAGDQRRSESFQSQEVVTRERSYGPLYRVGGPALLALGVVGLVAFLLARRAGWFAVSDTEREWLAYRDDYAAYADWIHRADLPPAAASLPAAETATLKDLVDIAIDTDESVVEVLGDRTFHVVHDEHRYVYEPPRLGAVATRRADLLARAPQSADGGDTESAE